MTASFFEYLGWVSLSRNLKESFNRTLTAALHQRHPTIETEHLLIALVDDPEGAIALNGLGVDRERLRDELLQRLDDLPTGSIADAQEPHPARELKKLMARASDLADKDEDDLLDGGDVIRALVGFDGSLAARLLQQLLPGRAAERREAPRRAKPQSQGLGAAIASARAGFAAATQPAAGKEVLGFDVDPIRASIESIMARRRTAEEILNQCEWYHLFKSLNQIEDGLEEDEQTHRAILLARAERELADRPRCRKAFLYVRHLDNELARLKGIVDADWATEFSPDEAVAELARMRQVAPETHEDGDGVGYEHAVDLFGSQAEIDRQISHIRKQESEVMALEKQLASLGRKQGQRNRRIEQLEMELRDHGEHGRKRSTAIEQLERFLRSEVMQSEERERRIEELASELAEARTHHEGARSEASLLADELASHRSQAGEREQLITELEARLAGERETATTHEAQIEDMRRLLVEEKARAEDHAKQMTELQKILDEERSRAEHHELQTMNLRADLSKRLDQLQEREEQIRILHEALASHQSEASGREEEMKRLQAELRERENIAMTHEEHLKRLEAELHDHQNRVLSHEEEKKRLEHEIHTRQNIAMTHEEHLKRLEAELHSHESRAVSREEQLDRLKAELADREQHALVKEEETQELRQGLAIQEAEGERQQNEINALRTALASLEVHQKQQETAFLSERSTLEQLLYDMRENRDRTEGLVEIIPEATEPYRIRSDLSATARSIIQHVVRRTIPVAKPHRDE